MNPSGFKTPVQIQLGDDGLWELLAPLVWEGSQGDKAESPKGEKTDLASVPRWLQSILPAAAIWIIRAAIIHDRLCNLLRQYYEALEAWRRDTEFPGPRLGLAPLERPTPPKFNAVDTDRVFEKIMRDEGASWLACRIGWLGVRLGAAAGAHRRQGWLRTAPRVARLSLLFLCLGLALLALVGVAALAIVDVIV